MLIAVRALSRGGRPLECFAAGVAPRERLRDNRREACLREANAVGAVREPPLQTRLILNVVRGGLQTQAAEILREGLKTLAYIRLGRFVRCSK